MNAKHAYDIGVGLGTVKQADMLQRLLGAKSLHQMLKRSPGAGSDYIGHISDVLRRLGKLDRKAVAAFAERGHAPLVRRAKDIASGISETAKSWENVYGKSLGARGRLRDLAKTEVIQSPLNKMRALAQNTRAALGKSLPDDPFMALLPVPRKGSF